MKRAHLVSAITLLFLPFLLIGQTPPPPPPAPPMPAMAAPPAPPAPMAHDCGAMMEKMKAKQSSAAAMDDRLNALVKEMNETTGAAKVDRMAAVINELVAQRQQMRDDMKGMPQMMQHPMSHEHGEMEGGAHSMADCPMMKSKAEAKGGHADHHAAMMARGAEGMGFSQETTTHHFVLGDRGGRVEVTANDATDDTSIAAIRGHLQHIATVFSKGDFDLPMFIHGKTPPGVADMKRLGSAITYRYEEVPAGGRVVITSADPAGVAAVHEFLRFQIEDHETGDPTAAPQSHHSHH